MKKIIFIIWTLILSQSFLDSHNFETLDITKEIKIQENEDLIINEIANMDFAENGEEFLICTKSTGTLRFDSKTGEIIDHILPSDDIYDLLIEHKVNPNLFPGDTFRFLNTEEQKKRSSRLSMNSGNVFEASRYYKNSIAHKETLWGTKLDISKEVVEGDFVPEPAYSREETTEEKLALFEKIKNRQNGFRNYGKVLILTTSLKDGSKNIIDFTNNPLKSPPNAELFYITDDHFYTSSYNLRYFKEPYKPGDSISVISKYTQDGVFLEIAETYPEKYGESGVLYSVIGRTPCCNIGSDVYITHRLHDSIVCITNREKDFRLKNIEYVTTEMMMEYGKVLAGYKEKKERVPLDTVYKYLKIKNENIFAIGDKLGIYALKCKIENGDKVLPDECIIQVYKQNGDLIKEINLEGITSNGELKYVDYDNINKNFYILRKSNQKGWTMEVAKWEI